MYSLPALWARYLIESSILTPAIAALVFVPALLLYRRAPLGSEQRRVRRRWFIVACIVSGLIMLFRSLTRMFMIVYVFGQLVI